MSDLEKNVQAAVKKLDCGNDEAAKEFKVQYYNLSFLENFVVVVVDFAMFKVCF